MKPSALKLTSSRAEIPCPHFGELRFVEGFSVKEYLMPTAKLSALTLRCEQLRHQSQNPLQPYLEVWKLDL